MSEHHHPDRGPSSHRQFFTNWKDYDAPFGNKLLLTFADSFTADQVSNARSALEEIAAEVFGEPMTIDVKTDSPTAGAPAAKSSSPLRDDPVVQAFQKHLGADIVESRKH